MYNKVKITIMVTMLGLLATNAAAQQSNNSVNAEQLPTQLKNPSVITPATKSRVELSTKQKSAVKKQKIATKKQKILASKPETMVKQVDAVEQKIVVKQQAGVATSPNNQIAKIRAEAQAIAQAAAKAQAAVQIQMAGPSAQVLAPPFNRTMRLPDTYNLPPAKDGFHDPGNDGINALHAPLDSFADLPRRNTGNRVDWVAALNDKKITPRWDRSDAQAEEMVMDMDIVRVPRGSMPNVVFPHKQHTQWLACSNCHPAIFIPQKGANQISMRLILNGEKCGVCHGKVAFSPSECRLCHSQKKELLQDAADTL